MEKFVTPACDSSAWRQLWRQVMCLPGVLPKSTRSLHVVNHQMIPPAARHRCLYSYRQYTLRDSVLKCRHVAIATMRSSTQALSCCVTPQGALCCFKVSGNLHILAALTQWNRPRYPLNRSVSGPQNRSGRCGEYPLALINWVLITNSGWTIMKSDKKINKEQYFWNKKIRPTQDRNPLVDTSVLDSYLCIYTQFIWRRSQ